MQVKKYKGIEYYLRTPEKNMNFVLNKNSIAIAIIVFPY